MSSSNLSPSEYKVYWFSRDLVATKFGNYAAKEKDTLSDLARELENDLSSAGSQNVGTLTNKIEKRILGAINRIWNGDISQRYKQAEDLASRIKQRIDDLDDVRDFIRAADAVVRTSDIIEQTPSFDQSQINNIIDRTLTDAAGQLDRERAYDALREVDLAGEEYQLGAQKEPLIRYISDLLQSHDSHGIPVQESARILSAITQEYERRVGQSRAATAGSVFEKALQRIFDQFNIPARGKPSHHGDLEIDNMVKGPDGSIGFSCKRTLRERFRQSLPREANIDVDEVWFVALLMSDVSEEKLIDIRDNGGRLYAPSESYIWNAYGSSSGLDYVLRPAEEFLDDVFKFTGV